MKIALLIQMLIFFENFFQKSLEATEFYEKINHSRLFVVI
jgi:hypothetical protein